MRCAAAPRPGPIAACEWGYSEAELGGRGGGVWNNAADETSGRYQLSLNRAVMLLLALVWPISVTAVVTFSGP